MSRFLCKIFLIRGQKYAFFKFDPCFVLPLWVKVGIFTTCDKCCGKMCQI